MTSDGWTEQVPELCPMPEGYLNNLEDDHWDKLYRMWDAFFSVCDRATGTQTQKEGFSEDWGVDTEAAKKQSGGIMGASKAVKNSGIEKEDDAKAAAQARAEEANMEKLLSTYGPEALRDTFWKLCKRDDPDITMLRFLRARKWDVEHTTAMMASTLKWRLDTNLDSLLENGDLGNGKQIPKYIENFDENGKVFSLGSSHKNQPVMYVQFAKHVIWHQPQATTKKFIIAHFELVRLLVVPPNDKIVLLFDCTGFGPSNLDVINFLYILQCLQSYFPETLATLYLHKAPWILQRAWHLVKWLLDPVVRAKVQFTNHAEELMRDIPKEHLLKYIGGQVDVDFKWVPPQEGENDLHKDTKERKRRWDNHRRLCNEFEQVTRRWAQTKGKEGGEERRILQKKLRLSHFDYEPYWLGRWVHHRNGDLPMNNPGIVRWEYPYQNGDKIREVLGHEDSRKSVLRELQEIAVGAPVEFAEKRTREMLKDGSWGAWDTCDDMPPAPTGYQAGQLIHGGQDERAAALIDVIGLTGPETLQEARAKVGPEQNTPAATEQKPVQAAAPNPTAATNGNAAPAAKTTGTPSTDSHPLNKTNGSAHPSSGRTYERPTSAAREKVDPEPTAAKGGFFASLKKKIYV